MKVIKRILALFLTVVFLFAFSVTAFAANGQVTYDGNAREFIFAPGSDHSVTDLFTEFKDVMPGDSISQTITVRNEASRRVKIKIYLRSLGAQPESEEFLSQMSLKVDKLENTNMFEAPADQKAQLTEWTYVGLLYSGGETELKVTLDVPTSLDNSFKSQAGHIDWEFKVEEFPTEPTDPRPPQTGDLWNYLPWLITFVASATTLFIIFFIAKRRKQNEN